MISAQITGIKEHYVKLLPLRKEQMKWTTKFTPSKAFPPKKKKKDHGPTTYPILNQELYLFRKKNSRIVRN